MTLFTIPRKIINPKLTNKHDSLVIAELVISKLLDVGQIGSVSTCFLIAVLAADSVMALVTSVGALFHNLTLGQWKLFSLSLLLKLDLSLFLLVFLTFTWALSALSKISFKQQFSMLRDFHTSINLVSQDIWLSESHPSCLSMLSIDVWILFSSKWG